MRKHKNKVIAGVVIAILLAFVFWYGGDAPRLRGWPPQSKETATVVQNDEPTKEEIAEAEKAISDISIKKENAPATEENKPQKQDGAPMTPAEKIAMAQKIAESTQSATKIKPSNEEYSEEQGMVINEGTGKGQYRTGPVPDGKPLPIEPENIVITDKESTCTLSIRCDTILNNIAWLDREKVDIVPKDGVVFAEKTVTFYEGESVFNLLMREMKRNKIHLEFENTPIYNSAYIEGIANLYEFECGELSGWMYKVNDWFPNYGCSRYQLKAGDKIEWVYTCDLGHDVGGQYSARNGK
ncbi:MAG: DUF4430 domain-containing protein [Ruminococcaceae bacterium]|nr:DUF4430 domain-containing protein [Oscillospiraceae bacterium]